MKPIGITIFLFFFFLTLLYAGYYWFTAQVGRIPEGAVSSNARMLSSTSALPVLEEPVAYSERAVGLYVRPAAGGIYPGVVMIHEWWGLNDNMKEMARTLAGSGYQVLAVDLYGGKVAATTSEAMALRNSVSKEETTANLRAAVKFLRDRQVPRIASLGWCYGGGKSLELALSGERLDATVIYYGALSTSTAELARINWPVLGIFGADDRSIPLSTVREFDAALDMLGVANEIHIYPGVGHAFANPSGPNYAPNETKDAWEKTLAFLNTTLKSSTTQ